MHETMSRFSTSVAIKQIGLGLALMGVATLATVVFNFLGTITGSVLAAMMFGTTRKWQWQIILVSLLFPAVMIGCLEGGKTDLTPHKLALLAGVCLGAFWLTYLGTLALLCFERPAGQAAPVKPTKQPCAVIPDPGPLAQVPQAPPSLPAFQELQVTWTPEAASLDWRSGKNR
jgi:hypothetical protein